MPKGSCHFTGKGGNYFLTVFFHLLILTLLTLGLYLPWAMVRILRLKASHMQINNKTVRFTGTGGQLFLLFFSQGLLTLLTLGLYGPWAICKVFTWRTQNTVSGGKASRFTGTGSALFFLYLIHLYLLPIITLGLYSFYGLYRLCAWKEEHTLYGGEKTSFSGSFPVFFKILLISCLLNIVTLFIFLPWSLARLHRWQINGLMVGSGIAVQHFPPVKNNYFIMIIFVLIGLIMFLAVCSLLKDRINEFRVQYTPRFMIQPPVSIRDRSPTPEIAPRPEKTIIQPDTAAVGPTFPPRELSDEELALELKRINNLIILDDRNPHAFYNRGWLYEYMGDSEKAVEDYTRALAIDPSHADSYYNRGLIYISQGKYSSAVSDFTMVLKYRKEADVYNNRGNAYVQMGKLELAHHDYNTALKMNPEDPDFYFNRGVVYQAMGEPKKARQDFQKAAEMGHEPARDLLGRPSLSR